ncbi:MAG: acylneuraminate cytidylyltransferase family protein [Alphaproteobacteria bacterium]|nr:acylneuraminate cytidylyltransferase family protein [Alphaproteobacteria bacterium]
MSDAFDNAAAQSQPGVVAFIFARGGSKGLPGKNIRPLDGKPLIGHAVDAAKSAQSIQRVVVSTDDEEIAAVARDFGAEVPFLRPADLATDEAPEWLAWQHALEAVDADPDNPIEIFVSVPPTAPLRRAADIDACVARLRQGDVDVVFAVTPAARNPYFNMVTVNGAGLASLVLTPETPLARRQAAPAMFDITTVCYAVRPAFLRRAEDMFEGRVGVTEVPAERAVDIDTEADFRIAEALLGLQKEK